MSECSVSLETSRRITSLRFLLAMLVVFIHNNYTSETIAEIAALGRSLAFVENSFGRWVQLFISNGLARAAVPLFFLFSAYLQARKNDSYGTLLKKKLSSLLVPYVIWILIYAFYVAGLKLIVLKVVPQLINHPEDTCLNWTAGEWLHKFFGYPSDNGDTFPGFAIQFWFVRDLLILVVLSPVLKWLAKKIPLALAAIVSILYFSPLQAFFVSDQALFFYVAGLFWGIKDFPLFKKIDRISWKEAGLLFLLCFVCTFTFAGGTGSPLYWLSVIFSCVIFLKLSLFIVNRPKLFSLASYLAGFSFFLYAIHMPALLNLVDKIWLHFLPMKNTFFALLEYFGVSVIVITTGTGIGIALNKICPSLFCVMNGGRVPSRKPSRTLAQHADHHVTSGQENVATAKPEV